MDREEHREPEAEQGPTADGEKGQMKFLVSAPDHRVLILSDKSLLQLDTPNHLLVLLHFTKSQDSKQPFNTGMPTHHCNQPFTHTSCKKIYIRGR